MSKRLNVLKNILLIIVLLFQIVWFSAIFITPEKMFMKKTNLVFYGNGDEDGRLIGVGRFEKGKWVEYVTFRTRSSAAAKDGNPSMRLNNLVKDTKSLEIGFYAFGPTLYTQNEIIECFIGDSRVGSGYGSFSVRSIDAKFGGRLEIRNAADTGAIMIDNKTDNYDLLIVGNQKKPISLIYGEKDEENTGN